MPIVKNIFDSSAIEIPVGKTLPEIKQCIRENCQSSWTAKEFGLFSLADVSNFI